MTIEKTNGVWAENGDRDEAITAAKKDVGFVGGDQPDIEVWNQLIYRLDHLVDRIVEERLNSYYDGATDHQAMITTGLWSDSWAVMSDAANVIECGATKALMDVAVFFNADGEPRLLVADNTNLKIEVWDPRTLAAATDYTTSDVLTDDLPASAAASIMSICTDGTYVYAVVIDTNTAPDQYVIQAWNIETWDVKTGWPATGTVLQYTGNTKYVKCIIASSTLIATINNGQAIAAAGDPVVELITIADGSTAGDGAGDAPTGVSAVADPVIASDGTYVYFWVRGGASLYPCSAALADPTTGCGGTGYGAGTIATSHAGAMASMGEKIITFINKDTPTAGQDIVISVADSTDALLEQVYRGQNVPGLIGDHYLFQTAYDAVFDGINVWAWILIDSLSSGEQMALIKIDGGKFIFDDDFDTGQTRDLSDFYPSVFMSIINNTSTKLPQMGIAFDGRDVWMIPEYQGSMANSGKICRVPLALIRH